MTDFYFFYPLVLLLIPIWLLASYSYHRYQNKSFNWDSFIDKPLQSFVISGDNNKQTNTPLTRKWIFWLTSLAGTLILLALSGPSFQQHEVPVYENQHGLVVALDLSASMLAEDIKPNRLQRAKFTLIDLLKQRKTGYTALVVFAGDAFAVTPLTNDTENIFNQLNFMSPAIMPAQGSRVDKAIDQSISLLVNAGYYAGSGDILLVTDGLTDQGKAKNSAQAAHDKGYRVSVIGVGTTEGSSIPLKTNSTTKRMIVDKQGQVIISKLDNQALQSVANTGRGSYFQADDKNSNMNDLINTYQPVNEMKTTQNKTFKVWVNAGIWMIFPVIIILLMLFPRGVIWSVFFLFLIPVDHVYAAETFDWDSLWLNQQQRAQKILENPANSNNDTNKKITSLINVKDSKQAKKLFNHPQWEAALAYRSKNYTLAAQLYAKSDTAEAWYNRGNALVKLGRLVEASQAYQVALDKQADHQDAQYNLALVKEQLQKIQQINHIQSAEQTNNQPPQTNNEDTITQQNEQQAFDKQWLKSIPDDPSGLWRRKFLLQYKKHGQQQEAQQW